MAWSPSFCLLWLITEANIDKGWRIHDGSHGGEKGVLCEILHQCTCISVYVLMATGQSMETRVSYQQWKEAITAFLETLNIIFSGLASGEEFCSWMIPRSSPVLLSHIKQTKLIWHLENVKTNHQWLIWSPLTQANCALNSRWQTNPAARCADNVFLRFSFQLSFDKKKKLIKI